MNNLGKIPIPPLSEFLIEDFMKPMGLDAQALSKGTGIPIDDIYGLINDKIAVTYETSAKLGAFFGISPDVFYNIQETINSRKYSSVLQYA